MTRLLLISNDYVGRRMAGPGIRYYHFARELSRRFDVTLLAPNASDLELEGVELVVEPVWRHDRMKRLTAGYDVVVAQHLPPRLMRSLARSRTRTIYDLYDPLAVENLPLYAAEAGEPARKEVSYRADVLHQELALATGDAFVCASERQRDLWLGALGALGRLDVAGYEEDAGLRGLIDVVPFGVETAPAVRKRPALKGVVDGIGADDRVLLWGGGIWNWFDPLTPIRAVARLAERRDDVKLYFLGLSHPNPGVTEMTMAERAIALARELGVEGRCVFFNTGWVPYEERRAFLLDADVGVSSHFAGVESRFAFRTRLLDYFWAGLPTIATRGDVLADLVAERGLGTVVEPEDVDGWAAAIEALVDDTDERARIARRLEEVRAELAWPRVVEPLAGLVERAARRARGSRRADAMVLRHVWLRLRLSVAARGAAGSAARAAALAAGRLRRAP